MNFLGGFLGIGFFYGKKTFKMHKEISDWPGRLLATLGPPVPTVSLWFHKILFFNLHTLFIWTKAVRPLSHLLIFYLQIPMHSKI